MTTYNTWLPGSQFYDFNDGVTNVLQNIPTSAGGTLLGQTFTIPNAQAGFGFTFDMVDPPFSATKPPKVFYSSTSDMTLAVQDVAGWVWEADCPQQSVAAERGWAWSQFALSATQTNTGTAPTTPAVGVIQLYQFGGAQGVFGAGNNTPQSISLCYVAGKTPQSATAGDIRTLTLTDINAGAHTWKVGTVQLVGGSRVPVQYLGALPFGLQMGGPHNRLAVLPYRGPIIAGYQAGAPWVALNDNVNLAGMLDFLLESQHQFQIRNPNNVFGPFMHMYLQALWDCEQTGPIDTWGWDGPDGNPSWDGWQYRCFDAMSRAWSQIEGSEISAANITTLSTICTSFLDWLYGWLQANPTVPGVPDQWAPPGWTMGQPFPADSYLDPKFGSPSGHDLALSIKGAIFCALSGYDNDKARYVIKRCVESLQAIQIVDPTNTDDMRGCFTIDPVGLLAYGFEQGEIMEALALCKQNPSLLAQATPSTM